VEQQPISKNVVFWDVAPCRSCVNRRFGGTYRLHLHPKNLKSYHSSTHSTTRDASKQEYQLLCTLSSFIDAGAIAPSLVFSSSSTIHALMLPALASVCSVNASTTPDGSRTLYPEDGSDTLFRNVGSHKIYTAPYPRRRRSS
jgi:hypothetical protein